MINNNEIWKSVVGFEGLYEVSSFGRIKSLPRFRKTQPNGLGYISKEKFLCISYVSDIVNYELRKDI